MTEVELSGKLQNITCHASKLFSWHPERPQLINNPLSEISIVTSVMDEDHVKAASL